MTTAGGHGGSTPEETDTIGVFVGVPPPPLPAPPAHPESHFGAGGLQTDGAHKAAPTLKSGLIEAEQVNFRFAESTINS
jgi:hypothetical protein